MAEQQAAEEERRRDPVKRAYWAGGALVALMVLWIVLLQIRLVSARSELSRVESQLQAVEENSKEARSNWSTAAQLENRLASLHRYSTNRFFCASVLNALQQVVLDDVRLVRLQSVHTYSTNSEATFRTNLVVPTASRKAWQFWKAAQPKLDILSLVSNEIAQITNSTEALKAPGPLLTKVEVSTNQNQTTARIEIKKPLVAAEQIVLTIKARDYSQPTGRRVDEFSKAIETHPYFAAHLYEGEGKGTRLRERAIQPDLDPADPLSPGRPFVPFIIECRYRDSLRANE